MQSTTWYLEWSLTLQTYLWKVSIREILMQKFINGSIFYIWLWINQPFGHKINWPLSGKNIFTLTMVTLFYDRMLGLFITIFNKDVENVSLINFCIKTHLHRANKTGPNPSLLKVLKSIYNELIRKVKTKFRCCSFFKTSLHKFCNNGSQIL